MTLDRTGVRSDPPSDGTPLRRTAWGLFALGALFLLWRFPTMWCQPGGQDEECYAVPGLTILTSGRPQMPQLPVRDTQSVFYRSDDAVYLEPPFFFYFQSLFYAVLPDTYGTARLASATAGVMLIALTGVLALRAGLGPAAALWGAGLFMMSRWLFFNATMARPDTLCSVFGLLTILAVHAWDRSRKRRWLLAAGVAIGLGGLTHPFALAYAVQAAGWIALRSRGAGRLGNPALVAAVSLAVAGLWIPLIVQYPATFRIQFRNQFVHDAGGSLLGRIALPWESLAYHVEKTWPHIGPWQFLLPFAGTAWALLARHDSGENPRWIGWLALSGAFLIAVLVGAHHPVFGYFSYPAALAFVGVGGAVDRLSRGLARVPGLAFLFGAVMVLSMLPGSGARATLALTRHFQDVNHNAPRFSQALLKELPADATYVVAPEFVLDFLAAGRRTLMVQALPKDPRENAPLYDYRIASRSIAYVEPERTWNDERLWSRGDASDPFACYAEVFATRRSVPKTPDATE